MAAGSHAPSLMSEAASVEQKAMCVSVSAMGYGKPVYARMYLFTKMTAALRPIHSAMYLWGSKEQQRALLRAARSGLCSSMQGCDLRAKDRQGAP